MMFMAHILRMIMHSTFRELRRKFHDNGLLRKEHQQRNARSESANNPRKENNSWELSRKGTFLSCSPAVPPNLHKTFECQMTKKEKDVLVLLPFCAPKFTTFECQMTKVEKSPGPKKFPGPFPRQLKF